MTGENVTEENLTKTGIEARVAVVTGASSGIGLAAAEEFARKGFAVAIVGRDEGRLAAARTRIQAVASAPIEAYRCDYASLAAVRDLAERLRQAYPRIDVLANNAGGIVGARSSTVDGFETTMQTNHLAPFLLSHELRSRLAGGRIVNTASRVHSRGRIDPADLAGEGRPYRKLSVYACVKQANVLFAAEATRRWPEIISTSFHPGVVRTRFGSGDPRYERFFKHMPGLRTPAKGAETLIFLATASDPTPGAYYVDRRLRRLSGRSADPDLAARLWEASAKAVGV
jgi:NAD(P)-dependent dehydrogenase (short-subunit alcohol dehydrogenase family)